MSVIRSHEAVLFEAHGARFASYASSATGSKELRLWRTEVPEIGAGMPHRITREEIFVVVEGHIQLTLDGDAYMLEPGDVAAVPAGTLLRLDNLGPGPAAMWVSTSAGLEAQLGDGTVISPPWAA